MRRQWQPMVFDSEAIREYVTELRHGHEITRTRHRRIPNVGELIAWRNRKAYRVVEVDEREQANWHDETMKAWERAGNPDPRTWTGRELVVLVDPVTDAGERRVGKALYLWADGDQWWPLREQYPTCNDCRLIWPCPCDERTDEARAAMKELNRLGGIMPGCCWACNEPVTKQHHSIVFEGDNLLLPGGGLVVFHTAESRKAKKGATCRYWAEKYEEDWTAADPSRPVRLRCTGILYRHYDRSECTEGEQCPSVHATHAGHAHCTTNLYDGRGNAELSPLTSCGGRGCRGLKVPAGAREVAA